MMLLRIHGYTRKKWHDNRILRHEFKEGKQVFLLNARLKLFLGKLKSRWLGLF